MIILEIKEDLEAAKGKFSEFSEDICIIKNDRDPILIVAYESVVPELAKKCNIGAMRVFTKEEKLNRMMEFHKLNYKFFGRADYVETVTG